LGMEHRAAIARFVERHGEAEAGRLVHDMLGYAIASAGYSKITVNPIGVPDFVLEGTTKSLTGPLVALPKHEVLALLELCERAGEVALATQLRKRLTRAG